MCADCYFLGFCCGDYSTFFTFLTFRLFAFCCTFRLFAAFRVFAFCSTFRGFSTFRFFAQNLYFVATFRFFSFRLFALSLAFSTYPCPRPFANTALPWWLGLPIRRAAQMRTTQRQFVGKDVAETIRHLCPPSEVCRLSGPAAQKDETCLVAIPSRAQHKNHRRKVQEIRAGVLDRQAGWPIRVTWLIRWR